MLGELSFVCSWTEASLYFFETPIKMMLSLILHLNFTSIPFTIPFQHESLLRKRLPDGNNLYSHLPGILYLGGSILTDSREPPSHTLEKNPIMKIPYHNPRINNAATNNSRLTKTAFQHLKLKIPQQSRCAPRN